MTMRMILGVLALSTATFSVQAQTADRKPFAASALQGDEAIHMLQQQGLYHSLTDAVAAARYKPRWENAAWCASNPAQHYTARFSPNGLSLAPDAEGSARDWRAALRFAAYGYGDHLALVGLPEVTAKNNRIEYRYTPQPVTEWYVNQAGGLEQGFTIAIQPAGRPAGARLRLVMDFTGDLRAQPTDGADAVELLLANGDRALRYSSLRAHDALGRELAAQMKATETRVVLEVDDEEALYPVTIDPLFTQQARLLGVDGSPGPDHFGSSVAIFANTAVVGAPDDDGSEGSAYVFVRDGANWVQQQKLVSNFRRAHEAFGRSVAIFWNTIVVGAPNYDSLYPDQGAAFVFERTGATWNMRQQLGASLPAPGALFGFSVAIDSYAGNTIVVGAPLNEPNGNPGQGSAYVFVRNGAFWSGPQRLGAPDGAAGHNFGWSVAVDGVLSAVVVGAPHAAAGHGAAYVFQPNNGFWSLQQRLTAADGAPGDEFGHAVAISLTGSRIVVGAPFDDIGANADQGSAYLFLRVAPFWSQSAKLTSFDGAAGDGFGWSVGVNGYDVVVGAPYDDVAAIDQGSAYLFECQAGCVVTQKLTSSFWWTTDLFGMAVAIDQAGTNTIMVGEPWGNWYQPYPLVSVHDAGSAYVFVR